MKVEEPHRLLHPSTKAGHRRPRLIVCDIDGTLVGRDHQINPSDAAALADARSAGFIVSICTGRSVREAIDIIQPLNLTGPGVFVTGATICNLSDGRTLARRTMEPPVVQRLLDFFESLGHAVLMLVDSTDSAGPHYVMTSGPIHAASEEWFLRNKMHARPMVRGDTATMSSVLRLGIVVDLPHSDEITGQLRAQFGDSIHFLALRAPAFESHVIEVFAPNVDKWTGIEQLCGMLNMDPADAIPIGDDVNDLPMLRNATLSFAMGNAAADIQRAAKRITRSQSEAGVASAIREILNSDGI